MLSAATGTGLAGTSVSPTRLNLETSQVSSYLLITNTGATPQRYSVAAFEWGQGDTDAIVLADTNDVVYFPGSFTLGGLQSQRIRVGTVSAASSLEKTYRIVVSELPPLKSVLEPRATGLNFTTSFSVPIYVAPPAPLSAGDIDNVSVDRNDLRFVVHNTGNVHFVATSMRVAARGDAGPVLTDQSASWFVLARDQRTFTIKIPRGSCSTIDSVSIHVEAGSLQFDRTVNPTHSCG
jgi:fimbrial chaperone protein